MSLGIGSAHAEGGTSIAAAPAVAYGQQEFGTIVSHDAGGCRAWWLLPMTTGDHLSIDWETSTDPYVKLFLYAPGTTDFNYLQTNGVGYQTLNSNSKAEFTFTAPTTGTFPLWLTDVGCRGNVAPGAYSLTAYVTHVLNVFLPHIGNLHSKGTVTVAVHDPAGGPIESPMVKVELQIKGRGGWHAIGAAPVSQSAAAIRYSVPRSLRHQRVAVRALAAGIGYLAVTSMHIKART